MFERFTERAREVVLLAQEEARILSHDYVGTEHILLGLLREGEGLAARVLQCEDITVDAARAMVVGIAGTGEEVSSEQIPFTPQAEKVLEATVPEAFSIGHNYVGTEHILLALVRESEGLAARVMLDFEADRVHIRNEVIRMLHGPGPRLRSAGRAGRPEAGVVPEAVAERVSRLFENLSGEIEQPPPSPAGVGDLGGSSQPASASGAGPATPRAQHVVVVASGKGGVGKSTVSLNLALALAESGKTVGLLDADVYAPDIPVMVNLTRKQHQKGWLMFRNPRVRKVELDPVERLGLKVMSAGFFLAEDQALSLPAQSAYFILNQLANHVAWGELDYLVVDLPPGTADVQQHIVSLLEPSGALIVVSPQDLAHLDAKKVISMFRESRVPVLGGIENMGTLSCPHCRGDVEIFPSVAESRAIWPMGVEKLAELPFDPALSHMAEQNRPLLIADPQGAQAGRFRRLAETVATALDTD